MHYEPKENEWVSQDLTQSDKFCPDTALQERARNARLTVRALYWGLTYDMFRTSTGASYRLSKAYTPSGRLSHYILSGSGGYFEIVNTRPEGVMRIIETELAKEGKND